MQKSKIKNQNVGSAVRRGKNYFQNFALCIVHFDFGCEQRRGMTILLVILVLSAILAISVGIFNVVFLETQIAGEITGSMRAIYIAEQGLERTLYLDLDNGNSSPVCAPAGPPTNSCIYTFDASTGGDYIDSAGACFRAVILKTATTSTTYCGAGNRHNCVASTGTYNCNTTRGIKRNAGFNY